MYDLFQVATSDFLIWTLIFFRIASFMVTMPFFGGTQIPVQVKTAFAMMFSFLLYRELQIEAIALPTSLFEYVGLIAKEIGIGILLGSVATLAFMAIQFGAEVIGIEMGLAQAQALDPLSGMSIPTVGQFMTMFTMAIFLLADGHHYLLKVFVDSFEVVPLLKAQYSERVFDFSISLITMVVDVGMRVAIPVLVFSFTLHLVLAFAARLIPQMNIFILSMPMQITGGLIVLSICLPLVVVIFRQTFQQTLVNMYSVMRML